MQFQAASNPVSLPVSFTDSNVTMGGVGVGEGVDLDFNILSEYLFTDEDKFPNWGLEDMIMRDAASDAEDHSSGDEDGKKSKGKGGGKNQDQIDRRRERNRVLARKTRLRKKFFFESLQKQVAQLATENELLKNVIKQRMDNDLRNQILSECKSIDLPPIIAHNAANATSMLEKADFSLVKAIQAAQRSFVITDPSLPDNPIIFASQGFLDLSGYRLEDVLGRNCRFMQGPNTDPKQVEILRKGIMEGIDTSVCLLNYRADGSQFYNQIFVAALRDADHKIINYVGVQVEIKQKGPPPNVELDNSSLEQSSTPLSGATPVNRPKRARKSGNSQNNSVNAGSAVMEVCGGPADGPVPAMISCTSESYAPGHFPQGQTYVPPDVNMMASTAHYYPHYTGGQSK